MSFLLNIAGNILPSIIGLFSNKQEQNYNHYEAALNRTFQTGERLAAQQFNVDMWNRNNEYNSPSAQVQRMIEAGINPNAAIGNSYNNVASNAPTTSPMSGSQASYSSGFGTSMLSSFANNALALANVEKTESETDLNKYELSWNQLTEKQRYESLVNMNNKSKAEIDKIFSDIGVNNFNKDLQERTYQWFASKSSAELDVIKEQLNVLRTQNLDILKGIELKDSQIASNYADIELKQSEGDLLDSQTQGQNINNSLQDIKKKYSEITGIPIDAPDSHQLFTLWRKGEWDNLSSKIQLIGQTKNDQLDVFRKPVQGIQLLFKHLFGNKGNLNP